MYFTKEETLLTLSKKFITDELKAITWAIRKIKDESF